MNQQTKHFYDFAGHRVDPLARVLLRGQDQIPIPPKAFDILLVLLQHRDRVVEKDELMKAVWPDSFVEEGNLSQNVFILRKALSDGQDSQRYIVTVPGRGYRFNGDVIEVQRSPSSQPYAATSVTPSSSARRRLLWISVALAALLAIALVWFFFPHSRVSSPISETQLTTNSSEASLTASAISPDGKSLAYADDHGLYLRYIASGETHNLPAPADTRIDHLSWFPDGSKLLASGIPVRDTVSHVWLVLPLQNSVRKLRDDAASAVASPDGQKILFTTAFDAEIWVMSLDGADARLVLAGSPEDAFSDLSWFPDGQRIFYLRSPVVPADSAESCELNCKTPAVLVSSMGILCANLFPDGRLLYGVGDWGTGRGATAFWELSVDRGSGRASGATHRISKWQDTVASHLSFSADGKRATILKGLPQADVYVSSLLENGAALRDPRRITLDDRNDIVSSWTGDSKAVLFSSNRNGSFDLFRQDLDKTNAISLVENNHNKMRPTLSPDGAWLLYLDPPISLARLWNNSARLVRTPAAGGPSETLLEERGLYFFDCSRYPANRCVAGIIRQHEIDFYSLDLQRGKGPLLVKTDATPDTNEYRFALSPDGTRLAVISLQSQTGKIRVISLADGSHRDIVVKGWNDLHNISWANNAKGWYVSSETATASTLLYVDNTGNSHPLLRQPGHFAEIWGVPSPDGQHLAFVQYNPGNNAWLLENF